LPDLERPVAELCCAGFDTPEHVARPPICGETRYQVNGAEIHEAPGLSGSPAIQL
jgi:hypothetical protein